MTRNDTNTKGTKVDKTFTLIDGLGFTVRFTAHASGNVSVEHFDRDRNSMGWPKCFDLKSGRSEYRRYMAKFGMKPLEAA